MDGTDSITSSLFQSAGLYQMLSTSSPQTLQELQSLPAAPQTIGPAAIFDSSSGDDTSLLQSAGLFQLLNTEGSQALQFLESPQPTQGQQIDTTA